MKRRWITLEGDTGTSFATSSDTHRGCGSLCSAGVVSRPARRVAGSTQLLPFSRSRTVGHPSVDPHVLASAQRLRHKLAV